MDCEYTEYIVIGISALIVIISELLPFIPEKYIKANGIIHLLLIIGKKLLNTYSNTTNIGSMNVNNMNINRMNVNNVNVT